MLKIKKVEDDKQLVFGEVYAPTTLPDSDGDVMTAETIEEMAYRFMKNFSQKSIDVEHDSNIVEAVVVESFIARENDPLFIEGSWVVGVFIEDSDIWELVKTGEINGFSLEGIGKGTMTEIEVEIPEQLEGMTSEDDGHEHKFIVKFDEDGQFLGGVTDVVNGHRHSIMKGTITEQSDNHNHKFSYLEIFENG